MALVLGGLALVTAACETVPYTGRSQLQLVSPDEEAKMAVQSYQEIVSKAADQGNADAQYNIGVVAQALGRIDEARSAYEEVLRARPDYAAAHHNLGNVYAMLGLKDDAAKEYRRAAELEAAAKL